jgi:hypothetical protein
MGGNSSHFEPRQAKLGSEPVDWIPNAKHDGDVDAIKHDDATIPIALWHDNLARVLGKLKLNTLEILALDKIREWINRIWKRSVTRCFTNWLRCKRCHEIYMTELFNWKLTVKPLWGKFKPGHILNMTNLKAYTTPKKAQVKCAECIKAKRLVKREVEVILIGKNVKYRWLEGKDCYIKWRMRYHHLLGADRDEYAKDVAGGVDCIRRAAHCTPWKWVQGSRLFFWRWQTFKRSARDGPEIFIRSELPNCKTKQSVPRDKKVLELVKKKLGDVRNKGYIASGRVKSVTSFFEVAKGDDDIRMVYNGTQSGLNAAVWAPWFSLPTVDTHLRAVQPGTFMADIDLQEMFLNFILHEDIRPYAGVDLTKLFGEELKENQRILWERWERLLMGFKPSPYLTTRELKRMEEFLCGDCEDPSNVFRWDKVVFNLPGSLEYDPGMPRVYRVRVEGILAGELFVYIDDLRCTCPTEFECWEGAHQICCRLSWLGLQDAPRKRSGASITPRAWAGSVIHSDHNVVSALVSQKKWDKTKRWIKWLSENVESNEGLSHKELERCIGFLIYVTRTYRPMRPYLRGMHKTLDLWRGNRDGDGWKYASGLRADVEDDMAGPGIYAGLDKAQMEEAPEFIHAVPRMRDDVEVLLKLMTATAPPKVIRRKRNTASVAYGFGDASGKGFGYGIEINGKIYEEFGQWHGELESMHSNYKELRNLVNAVENVAAVGLLKDAELFLFTDNFTAECAYYRGGSNKNKLLNELVFKLWRLQMHEGFELYVYHIAGTRMIESGIDGLSRGDKFEGIARGVPMLNYVPIHLSPIERSPILKDWLEEVIWDSDALGRLEFLTSDDWFKNMGKQGNFVWNVPPAAGEFAMQQLAHHTHI